MASLKLRVDLFAFMSEYLSLLIEFADCVVFLGGFFLNISHFVLDSVL
jgi:hypothetical protein